MIEGIIPLLRGLRDILFTGSQSHYVHYMSRQMSWELEYLAQGKRYPSPKRRKSQARMSREWRGRA